MHIYKEDKPRGGKRNVVSHGVTTFKILLTHADLCDGETERKYQRSQRVPSRAHPTAHMRVRILLRAFARAGNIEGKKRKAGEVQRGKKMETKDCAYARET